MKSNLKVLLSAVGVAALLASPALAKSHSRHNATQSLLSVPADTRASTVGSYATSARPAVEPYAADLPVAPHQNGDLNPDFQLGGEK